MVLRVFNYFNIFFFTVVRTKYWKEISYICVTIRLKYVSLDFTPACIEYGCRPILSVWWWSCFYSSSVDGGFDYSSSVDAGLLYLFSSSVDAGLLYLYSNSMAGGLIWIQAVLIATLSVFWQCGWRPYLNTSSVNGDLVCILAVWMATLFVF